ncbi:FIG00641221: hypothetical protein [Cronobacter sakazakii 696]|nr:FIG00641221: hypothetical protein [Cronobacter sakazakii 696]
MRNAARAERHRLHAAGFDIAFVNDGRVQVTGHIDSAGGDKIKAPRHRAENRQRADGLQMLCINIDDFRFRGVIENLGEIRARAALLVHGRVQFVDDNTGDVGVFAAAEAAARQLDTLFQLFRGIGALRHHEHDFRVQGLRDFIVQRLGELMLTGRHQAFHQHHFGIFGVLMEASNDLFHQHVFLVAGEQRLDVAHAQRLSGWQIGVSTHDSCGLVRRIAASTWLGDRFEDAQTNAFTFHSADHAEADAGQADAGSGRNKHNDTGHGLSSFCCISGGRRPAR